MGFSSKVRSLHSQVLPGLVVLLVLLESPAAGQPPATPLPGLPDSLREFIAAGGQDRDAIVRGHRSELLDTGHRLLLALACQRAGIPEVEGLEDPASLAQDWARRVQAELGIETFMVDLRTVLGLSEDQVRRRALLCLQVHHGLAALPALVEDPSQSAELAQALKELSTRLQDLRARSQEWEDGDLRRLAALVEVRLARLAARLGKEVKTSPLGKALLELRRLLASDGLNRDLRSALAGVELASLYLREGAVPAAGDILSEVRRETGDDDSLAPEVNAQLLSLEIELHQARGFATAALESASRLNALLPVLAADAQRSGRPAALEMVGDYHLQVALLHGGAGAHARAREVLRDGLSLPGLRLGQTLRLKLHLGLEEEILGATDRAAALAGEVCEAVPGLRGPSSPEQSLAPALELKALHLRARLHTRRGESSAARLWLSEASSIIEKQGERLPGDVLAENHLASGLLCALEGDIEGALAACDRAYEILEPGPVTTERLQALWSRSRLLLLLGEDREALEAAEKALAAAEEASLDHDFLVFNSELLVAQVLLSTRRPEEALALVERCLARNRSFLDSRPAHRGQALRLRAEARWHLVSASRQKEKGLERLATELRQAVADLTLCAREQGGNPDLLVEILKAYELLQEMEIDAGGAEQDSEVLEEASQCFRDLASGARGSLQSNEAEAVLHLLEARRLEWCGRNEDAVVAYRQAARLENRLRGSLRYRAPDGLSARFETIHDRIAGLLLESAAQHGDAARAHEALLFLEEVRARSLRVLLATAASRRQAFSQRNAAAPLPEPLLREPDPPDLHTLRQLLAPERAVLVFALTGRGVFVIGLREARIAVARVGLDRAGVERLVHGLRDNLQGPPDRYRADAVLEYGQALHRELVAPMEDLLAGAEELVIIPDGVLHGLPFAALVEKPVAPLADYRDHREVPYLGARRHLRALVLAPSLATLALLDTRPPSKPGRQLLVLADPLLHDPALRPLPHARREAHAIASLFPAEGVTLLLGPEATPETLVASRPGEHGILHLASHAKSGLQRESPASLILAPGRRGDAAASLDAVAVAGLNLTDTHLVVLSACSSGLGRPAGCEGLLGLPRAFLIAGARSVMAATLEIADEETSALMAAFYQRLLRQREKPARALLEAMRGLLAQKTTSWPGFWSPFLIVSAP